MPDIDRKPEIALLEKLLETMHQNAKVFDQAMQQGRVRWKLNQKAIGEQAVEFKAPPEQMRAAVESVMSAMEILLDKGLIRPAPPAPSSQIEYQPADDVLSAFESAASDNSKFEVGFTAPAVSKMHGQLPDIDERQALVEELDGYLSNLAGRARTADKRTYPLIRNGGLEESVKAELTRRLALNKGTSERPLQLLQEDWTSLARARQSFSWGKLVMQGDDVLLEASATAPAVNTAGRVELPAVSTMPKTQG